MESNVFINKVAAFLPNEPVDNDSMELYLGMIGGKPSRVKSIILRQNKIKTRYYSLNREEKVVYSNAEMTALAIQKMYDENHKPEDISLLCCGTSVPDQILPSFGSMVHGELKSTSPIEVISTAGVCCSGMSAFKYAFMSILSQNTPNAVCAASELLSPIFHARNYEKEYASLEEVTKNPIIAFEKDFLRWMLSDGAGAFWMSNKPNEDEISLKIEWIESVSYANTLQVCMYQGGEKNEDGELIGWKNYAPEEWLKKSIFSIKQDTRYLDLHVIPKSVDHIKNSLEKRGVNANEITWFLPHISSMYFYDRLYNGLQEAGINIPLEKWFTNLTSVGNIGSASIYIMLEELFNSGKLKKGEKIFLYVPESGRFSYTVTLLTVV